MGKTKRGQFYLIAAVIIVAVILGFFVITNSSTGSGTVRVYELKEELGIESGEVIEYGTYSELDEPEMEKLLEGFAGNYTEYAGDGRDIIYVIGNRNDLKLVTYEEITSGSIGINTGGETSYLEITEEGQQTTNIDEDDIRGNKVEIKIDEQVYTFELKGGDNFYFIISQEEGGERHVATS